MENILFRKIQKCDYHDIKNIICEAFGWEKYVCDESILANALNMYLHSCLSESTYSQVAIKNNKVIGIILGHSQNKFNPFKRLYHLVATIYYYIKLKVNLKNNNNLNQFSKLFDAYKSLLKNRQNIFQGSIDLFAVSKESRGLGIGKHLVNTLFNYMKLNDVENLYLLTDTMCNFGFYDSQGFERIDFTSIYLSNNDKLDIFLYSYTI